MSDAGFPKTTTTSFSYPGKYTSPTGVITNYTQSGSFVSRYEDMISQDSPGWPEVVRENYYYRHKSTLSNTPLSYQELGPAQQKSIGQVNLGQQVFGSSNWMSNLSVWSVMQQIADDSAAKLVNRLASSIKDQKVNIAQVIGEREQTKHLILGTAKKLASSIHSLKRGNVVQAVRDLTGNSRGASRVSRAVGGVPSEWLALQYGWKPLLGDIYGSAEQLANSVVGSKPVTSTRNSVSFSFPFVKTLTNVTPQIQQIKFAGNISGRCYGFLEFKLSSVLGQSLSSTGLLNPYALAWELFPWSFVVDWFLPIGQYLANFDYETGLIFNRGWNAIKFDFVLTGVAKFSAAYPGYSTYSRSAAPLSLHCEHYVRNPYVSAPLPQPPRFKDPFSLTHVANGLSLLATAFDQPDLARRFSRLG